MWFAPCVKRGQFALLEVSFGAESVHPRTHRVNHQCNTFPPTIRLVHPHKRGANCFVRINIIVYSWFILVQSRQSHCVELSIVL